MLSTDPMPSSETIRGRLTSRGFAFVTMLILCSTGFGQTELDPEDLGEFADAGRSSPGGSQDIVVETIGGLPLARCVIRFQQREIQAHLMFDVSLIVPFQIHESSLNGLGLNAQAAVGQKVEIDFGNGVELLGVPIETERYPLLVEHTRIHAPALGETPVVGFIGPAAFSSNVIELDMAKGLLRTMGLASDEARDAEVPYSLMIGGIVVKGTGPAATPVRAALSTRSHDSGLAPSLLKLAREKGERPNVLQVADVNWGERSALRFEPFDETWPSSVNAVIGADALARSTVTLWPKRKKIALRPGSTSSFSESEQIYFLALADRDTGAIEKFIASSPRRRLLDEACLYLFEIMLLDSNRNLADLKKALDTIADHYRPERRSEILLDLADTLEEYEHSDREALVEHALTLAVRESPKALEQTAVHDVHVRIGRRALTSGNLKQARRHLLSAAFGMPRNAECNYWLGEFYRETGEFRRAWSRYFQVLLDEKLDKDDPVRADALQRLSELNRDAEFREAFNMIEAEEYMAGRLAISEFHAQTRYRFMRKRHPHHVRLVELFVDPTQKLGGGMELAFQAIDEFFEGEVVLAAYHLDGPLLSEAARQRLSFYEKQSAPLLLVDGEPMFETAFGKGKKPGEDATLHYPQLRAACLPEAAPEASAWNVGGKIDRDAASLKVSTTVTGGADTDDLRLVVLLCERSVMEVESNGVFFHHFVVRDQLTPPEGLDLTDLKNGLFEVEVDIDKLRQRLAAASSKSDPSSPKGEGPFIDVDQLYAVGMVQRASDSRILSARKVGFPKSQ